MRQLTIVALSDWQAWYVDGILVHDDHDMETEDVIRFTRELVPFSLVWINAREFCNIDNGDVFTRIGIGSPRKGSPKTLRQLLAVLTDEEFETFTNLLMARRGDG